MKQEIDFQIMTNDIDTLVNLFKNVNRNTKKSNLPKGFRQLKKEIFTNNQYVIKFTNFKKNNGIDDYVYKNEAEYLTKLHQFDFIPKFYGEFYKNKNIYLVMEYLDGSSLDNLTFSEYFFIKKNIELFEKKLKYILEQFRIKNLIHRDIRPHNIILAKTKGSFDIKVIDFQYMINYYIGMDIPINSKKHYEEVIKNIGSIWRNKDIDLNSFENDEHAISKIINDLKYESIFSFIIRKIKGCIN